MDIGDVGDGGETDRAPVQEPVDLHPIEKSVRIRNELSLGGRVSRLIHSWEVVGRGVSCGNEADESN